MSNNWNEGYFTDAGYTYGYYKEINPVFQRFCLLIQGVASNAEARQHCELGFGQGVSILIHAAANPGHFVGTDFNPAHAAHALALAQESGLDAQLYDASFKQLLDRDDIADLDSISLHGIWTWVSPENHKIIAEFSRKYLKPGGVVYNSYNCFPGWSPAYPMRQLFSLYDRYVSESSRVEKRVKDAVQFAENLLETNPAYLRFVPSLKDRLKQVAGQNPHYIVHEYFNRDWNCMYFTDVVDLLSSASKLEYAASANPLDCVDVLNLTPQGAEFLKKYDHPIMREQIRDYLVNRQFRKDLFVRGQTRLLGTQQKSLLLNTRVVLTAPPESVDMTVNVGVGEAKLQEAVYKPILEALAKDQYKPKTIEALQKSLPGTDFSALAQAMIILVGMGAVSPCQSEQAQAEVAARCKALNKAICQRALFGSDITVLASPLTGGGIVVGRFQQLFLLGQTLGHKTPQAAAQYVWQLLESQGQRLIKDGKTLETPEENMQELSAQAKEFMDQRQPILKALAIQI